MIFVFSSASARTCIDRIDHSLERSPVGDVDKWIEAVEKQVPGVNDVVFLEIDEAVAVRMGKGRVHGADMIAVDVVADIFRKGRDWEPFFFDRLSFHVEFHEKRARGEPVPDVVMGKDQRAALAQVLVSAGMVPVVMGVDDEFGECSADGFDCLDDFVRQRSELVVDQECSVLSREHSQVAAFSRDHVYSLGNRDRRYFDIRVFVGLNGRNESRNEKKSQKKR